MVVSGVGRHLLGLRENLPHLAQILVAERMAGGGAGQYQGVGSSALPQVGGDGTASGDGFR